MSLTNQIGILFGGGVLAKGYAHELARHGARLVIVSRGKSADELAAGIEQTDGTHAVSMHADVSDFEQVGRVIRVTADKLKHIDFIVNGAGGNKIQDRAGNELKPVVHCLDDFLNMDPQAVCRIMETNFDSKWYGVQHFARYLEAEHRQGSVVNITSMAGLMPLTKVIGYSAAYAAVENLTRSFAYLLGVYNLARVNNIAVGFTCGDQNRQLLYEKDGKTLTPRGQEIIDSTAQRRFLDPAEIAPAVHFLLDKEMSGAITGATIRVDGGFGLVSLAGTGYAPRPTG